MHCAYENTLILNFCNKLHIFSFLDLPFPSSHWLFLRNRVFRISDERISAFKFQIRGFFDTNIIARHTVALTLNRTSITPCLGQREQTFQIYIYLGITAVLSPPIQTSSITKAISKADTGEDYMKKT